MVVETVRIKTPDLFSNKALQRSLVNLKNEQLWASPYNNERLYTGCTYVFHLYILETSNQQDQATKGFPPFPMS